MTIGPINLTVSSYFLKIILILIAQFLVTLRFFTKNRFKNYFGATLWKMFLKVFYFILTFILIKANFILDLYLFIVG